MQTPKAAIAYFSIVFAAGFLLGIVRVPLLVPPFGEHIAELMEMPLMLLAILFAARWTVQRFSLTHAANVCLGVGLIAANAASYNRSHAGALAARSQYRRLHRRPRSGLWLGVYPDARCVRADTTTYGQGSALTSVKPDYLKMSHNIRLKKGKEMSYWKQLTGPMRLPFLVLTQACVLLGVAVSYKATGTVDTGLLLITLLGALSAHISVNAFNEYADFKSGLDALTVKTPFSGGSGTLPAQPELASTTLAVAVTSLLLTIGIGGYFLIIRGQGLLPLGLAGILVILSYTPWINRHPWLCLLAPGLGFGPLMVMGTAFVLTGQYLPEAFAASLIPFFLVSGLLLLNQFPDVEADKHVGRRNLPILFGRRASSRVFALLVLLAFVSLLGSVVSGLLPRASLVGLTGMLAAVPLLRGVYRHADDIGKLIPYMGLNVALTIAMPVLVATGVWLG